VWVLWRWLRDALAQAGRADLIGGCDGLIPAHPPKEALEARRREADHYHTVANPAQGGPPGERGRNTGYRPGCTTAQRRDDRNVVVGETRGGGIMAPAELTTRGLP